LIIEKSWDVTLLAEKNHHNGFFLLFIAHLAPKLGVFLSLKKTKKKTT
jgi:hypothetical protein